MAGRNRKVMRKRALRVQQNPGHPLYLFSLTGEELMTVADVSRISRDDVGKLIGYQRPEVRRHVQDIVEYLNTKDVLFPNSLILAVTSRVRFTRSRGPQLNNAGATAGVLEIPLPSNGTQRPAWIVDGQQRALALSKSGRREFPVPVNAFVADEVDLQRDQFLRINNTKPLPRGLITELLPEVVAPLPPRLAARRVPASICDLLHREPSSPFYGLIRRSSASAEQRSKAVVTDLSVIRMVEESLLSPSGCLYPYRNIGTGETDFPGLWRVLVGYWTAVKLTFPAAWGRPPSESRLMHGVGIRAMGRVMDRVMASLNVRHGDTVRQIVEELRILAPECRWTDGVWEEFSGGLRWNEVQNVPRHLHMVSNFLVRVYTRAKGQVA
jgi:DGQHR domain-containing protein